MSPLSRRIPPPIRLSRCTTAVGFFTDTSICIGCKACEVACKEWNSIPGRPLEFTGRSYDNTNGLGANTWRHVAFIEQEVPLASSGESDDGLGVRWLMASDVCKHCTEAACLDVCPTGALFRTEFGTVVVQEDVCNGCGYCVTACPYGVLKQARRRWPDMEVHPLLRPIASRHGAGLCEGVSDRINSVRRAR